MRRLLLVLMPVPILSVRVDDGPCVPEFVDMGHLGLEDHVLARGLATIENGGH